MIEILKRLYLLYGEALIHHDVVTNQLYHWLHEQDIESEFYNYFELEKYLVDMGYVSVYDSNKVLIHPYTKTGIWYYQLKGDRIYE